MFNAVDLEGAALEALIHKSRQAVEAVLRPEPERLVVADAVLSSWPVPDRMQLPDRTAFHSAGEARWH